MKNLAIRNSDLSAKKSRKRYLNVWIIIIIKDELIGTVIVFLLGPLEDPFKL